jgi:hypothetical protein
MLLSRIKCHLRAGFSLVTASVILTVAALVFVSILPGDTGSNNKKNLVNTNKLERVEEAMRSFMAVNGRLPCPADGQYAFNTANFGIEAATPGTCTGGTPAAPLGPDTGTGFIVGGVIPTKTLALPDDYAVDAFGHRFGYVVDKRATLNSSCLALATGGINIKNATSGNLLAQVMHAFISFGASGYGAYPANGSAAGPANRINSGSTDGDMQTNAGLDAHFPGASAFTYSTTNWTNTLVQKARVAPTASDSGFDDMVWYRNDLKKTCALGPLGIGGVGSNACSTASPHLTNFASPTTVTIGTPVSGYANSGDATCTAHSLACVSGSPNSLTCDGSGTLTNCEYSTCTKTCTESANQGGATLNGASPGNTANPEYSTNSVTSPATCPSANTLTCTNGVLSCSDSIIGDCAYNSCVQVQPGCSTASLTSFSPSSMTSGQTLPGYVSGGDSTCTSHNLTCTSGTLTCDGSGTLTNCEYSSCLKTCSTASLTSFSPATMTSGQSLNGYATSSGTCTVHTLLCTNSALTCDGSGTLTNCEYSSCSAGGSGNMWVIDKFNNRAEEFNSTGTWLLEVPGGCANSAIPACATSAVNGKFSAPNEGTVDSSGNVWVSDLNNNRIEEFNSNGTFLQGLGAGYHGVAGTISNSGHANGQINQPYGVAVSSSGSNIWVSDAGNNRVEEYNSIGTYLLTFPASCAGVACAGSTTNGSFDAPYGIAIDTGGNIWVADDIGQRVQELSNTGTFITGLGAGYHGVAGTIGMAGYLNGQMDGPLGLAIDGSNNIWEVDATNNRVQKFNSAGTWLLEIPGGCANSAIPSCAAVATAGKFNFPKRIAFDGSGNLWVGDGNNRVQQFNSNGTYLQTWPAACAGVACAATYTNGSFDIPTGIGFR